MVMNKNFIELLSGGYEAPEGGNFQATSMNSAEAIMGMNEQGGMKRHKTKPNGKKALAKAIKRKRISKQSHLKKNNS